ASNEPERRGQQYRRIFSGLGASDIHVVHAEKGATPDDLLLIENATGIFVTGGDQEKLMSCLRRTGCAAAIVNAVRGGAVYCGTSAGAAAVSKKMIFARAVENGREVIGVAEGLGLVPSVIIDQHFSERQRLPRLLDAVRRHGLTGVGLDENTAAVFEGGSKARVSGASSVTVIKDDEIRVAADGELLPL
ncbi:MAG TPA: cyanophycinase, partial [Thermoanaerobaculia bacterium]|nr:cyanophycinase [Thermoanaerobaculia bacterium]